MNTTFGQCLTCKGWDFLDKHGCPPRWDWRCDYCHAEDEWESVYAYDVEAAATKAAESYDECDQPLFRTYKSNTVLMVRNADGEVSKWEARAEAVPHYYVKRV